MGIKIYAVGVGKEGGAPVPFMHPAFGKVYSQQLTVLDEAALQSISSVTNGTYFRAVDSDSLEKIYAQIDELEKTEIKQNQYVQYSEYFPTVLNWVLWLILLELVVFNTVFVVAP